MVGFANADPFRTAVQYMLVVAVGWVVVTTPGCRSARQHRADADALAADMIARGQAEALGRTEPFTISRAANELRRRLLVGQNLPRAAAASLGVDQLQPLEHWPKDDYLTERGQAMAPPVVPWQSGVLKLTLDEALQVGARNSRSYQTRKESVFLTALDLDVARQGFRTTFAGALETLFTHDLATDTAGLTNSFTTTLNQRFESGLSITSRLIFDLAALLTQNRGESLGIFADISATIPLLSGSGRHIVRESLTQAERNVLYALWDFERYKRTFVVGVASDYLSVLQQLDRVENAEANYKRRLAAYQRAQALAEEGVGQGFQADQARQTALEGLDALNAARTTYQQRLDQFKITLGLPTDARIALDRGALERLAEVAKAALALDAEDRARLTAAATGDAPQANARQTLGLGGREKPGPMELSEPVAVGVALAHRLDLREQVAQVVDAQRAVVIAADALGVRLSATVGGSVGERRSGVGSATLDNAQIRFDQSDYYAGLEVDLPWEKTAERAAYRESLVSLERAVRNVQELEDEVKLQIRGALRTLARARQSIRIQDQALGLAQRRVEGTGLLFEAGRVQIRDVLEAQDALVTAQNELTNALVSYRVAELELQRDMGVLQVNEKGLWREYQPDAN